MKCTHESCGADILAGARFCIGCGTEVQSPVPVKTTLCPSCNNNIVEGCKICQSCGGKIDPALFIDRICHVTKDNGQKCNTVFTSGTKFCPSCGTFQDASNTHDTSSKDDFPGDAALKLNLKTTQQKEDNQIKTTPPIKEEHGSSGSSSPDLWEAPTILLQSNANKTDPVKAENTMSGSDEKGVKTETDTSKVATAEEMDVTEIKHETNDPVQTESEITNMETQIAGPQSNRNNSDGKQNPEKLSNATETDDQYTKLQGDESDGYKQELNEKEFTQIKERQPGDMLNLSNLHRSPIKRSSGTDIALVASKRRKDIIEDPSDKDVQKPEIKYDTTDAELQVILISDSESVEDGQGSNEELVNTNVKPSKRKLEEENGHIKKIRGEKNKNLDTDTEVQHGNTQPDEKHGIQETGDQGNNDGNTGQSAASTAEHGKNTKDENKQDTEKTNKKQTNNQVVKQGEDTDEEKHLKENSNQKEDQLPTKRITRSMQDKKNEHQSNQTQELPKKNGTNSRTDQKPSERTDTFNFGLTHFTVHFHAIMHSSIFDESCKAFVRFASDNLGGWRSKQHELFTIGKDTNNGNIEVEGRVSVPRGFIEKGISYRYFIVCGNDEQQEFVYNGNDNLRWFFVTNKQLKSFNDVFHQYDGVIRGFEVKEGSIVINFIKYVTGYENAHYRKILFEDARQSACTFLPSWQTTSLSPGLTGDDMIMRISLLYRGLRYGYCKNSKALSEQDLKNFFSETIRSRLDTLWTEFISKREFIEENRMKIFLNAVTVAYLFKEYAFLLSSDEKSALSVALLPEMDMSGQSNCIENLKEVFPQSFQKIQWALINVVDNNMSISWLCCMPLLHFLVNQCYPGEKPNKDTQHDYGRPYWWGIADKDHYWIKLKNFKEKNVENELLQDMLERLVPYFEMDYLLPRALMASLNLEQLPEVVRTGHISTDIILASVCYYVKEDNKISKNDQKETAIIECLNVVKSKFCEENNEKSVDYLTCAWRSCMIAADVLKCMKDRKNKLTDNVMILALDAFLISLHVYCTAKDSLEESADKPSGFGSYDTTFKVVQYGIRSWLNDKMNQSKNNELLACLKSWDRILNVAVPAGLIKDQFTTFIAESLHDVLKYKSFDEELVKVYCQNQSTFCEAMLEVLTKYAFDAVVNCSRHLSIGKWKEGQLKNFGKLLSVVFEKHITQDISKDFTSLLQFVLTWNPFPLYVKMYNNNVHAPFLSENCVDLMKEFQTSIKCVGKGLFDRSITMGHLQIIEEKQEHFINIVKDIPEMDSKGLKRRIELRTADMNAFHECMKNLNRFIDICHRSEVNTFDIEEQMKKLHDFEDRPLKEICAEVDVPQDVRKYKPRIIAFEINAEILEALPEIIRCSNGNLFIKMWDKCALEVRKRFDHALGIDEIMEHVWKPACKEWKALHQRLKTGEIFFREFDSLCGRMDPEALRKEFLILEDGKKSSWIKERIEQMSRYKNLQNCLDGASIIMEVVEEFELEGDFQPIRQIMRMTKGKDTKMNHLNKSYLKTCSVLSNVDEQKVNCLKRFMESKNLVNWLKEKMDDLQELKVFVDLAYISTGDKGLEIAKVRCLQSAAIGYAPLIFNLEANCDYKDFLERCEEVWKALHSNPNLPTELLDTCHELEWLKIVDKSQGSVEVTSLAQAEAINLNGTYHIGLHKTGDGIQRKGQNQLQLSDILELRVTEKKEGKTLRREYNYEQLHDLQSRLMLVAGKAEMGKDDVDRFILILDSVVRLCNVYIKLLSSGCVLFSKFKVKFRCDPESVACAFVSFGEGEIKRTIRGKIDAVNQDVSFFIPKIAKFLEHCHERWLEFIDEKREDFYILNYFSIEQTVILQQELVKMGFEGQPSNQIYPLLSNIKHDCTRDDLVGAMEEARDELEQMDIDEDEEVQEEVPMEEENSEAAKGKFILQMVEAGYSEGLAREALKNVTPDQIDEGIAWCIEHEEEAMDFETSATDGTSVPNQDKRFSGWSTRDESLASVRAKILENIGVGPTQGLDSSVDVLIENLEKLWENFVGSISSSVTDYLSVEHLALILRKLADKETMSVERSFSVCGCKEGVANLIVCSQSEMYNTVLSLYSTEDDSLLPQSDEVLLCTPDTTLDLLEIFWRRSLFGDSGKIYCLVNADLLDYEVSDKGEKLLEKHMKNAQNRDIQFKLVVVCSRENEYKSRMVAALDKYRRPQMSFGGEKHVKTYLSERFIVNKPISGVETASSVDFNRSSVRVVKSWRAGVGKSLFKKNMVNALMEKKINVDEENCIVVSIPLYDRALVVDEVLEILLEHTNPPHVRVPRIFHFDISHEVQDGVDAFLFQLLVLGCLSHTSGNVWRRSDMDYYIIESMPLLARDSETQVGKLKCMHRCLDILPDVLCRSPKESLDIFDENFPDDFSETDLIFDESEFASETFQRPYQYLSRLDGDEALTDINPEEPEGDREDCLQILLRHCGVKDPSWSELYHFVSFLNRQLQDFETSAFCSPIVLQDLPGFPAFVLKFLIQMSRDFATRSLQISEESPIDMLKRQLLDDEEEEEDIEELYEMRRKWESSPHPYLFFNPDHHTMTFLGFNIEKATGNLIDDQTGESLEDHIMDPTLDQRQRTLYNGLNSQPGVNLSENFDKLSRGEKIEKLCQVMGIEFPHDPDETYELTTDNVKKILAIYMRFR